MCAVKKVLCLALIPMLFGAGSAIAAQSQRGTVVGVANVTAADGQTFPVPGVRLTLTCGIETTATTEASTKEGKFEFANVPVGHCVVSAELPGFKSARAPLRIAAADVIDLPLHLELDTIYMGLTVTGVPPDGDRAGRPFCNEPMMTSSQAVPLISIPLPRALGFRSAHLDRVTGLEDGVPPVTMLGGSVSLPAGIVNQPGHTTFAPGRESRPCRPDRGR